MRHQLQPEGHFGGSVVIAHAGLQADVQVQLVLGVVLGPGHLLEAVGFGVNELGVLRNGLVGVAEDTRETEKEEKKRSRTAACHKATLTMPDEITLRSSHMFIHARQVPEWQ